MGFLSAYQSFGLHEDDLKCVWDFETTGAFITDVSPNGVGSGVFLQPQLASFWQESGESFWSGEEAVINNAEFLDSWELFLVFSRSGIGPDFMITNRVGETGNGFSFGVNDANVPFIYMNTDGNPVVRNFDQLKIYKYNAVCLSKGRDSITLSIYHPFGGYTESETISVKNGTLGNGNIRVGLDSRVTGFVQNSFFVGELYELALYQDGMLNVVRTTLLDDAFSSLSGVARVEGMVSDSPHIEGVSLYEVESFENINKKGIFSYASNRFIIPERENLDSVKIYADGIFESGLNIDDNGVVEFDGSQPTNVIYDIYITGRSSESWYYTTPDETGVYFNPGASGYYYYGENALGNGSYIITFTGSTPTNSFYGSDGTLRLEKNIAYFEASEIDLFFGARVGAVESASNNILCRK